MINPDTLKAAVLKATPYENDSHYINQRVTLLGITDYFNPKRDDIVREATDAELKRAIRALVKEGLLAYKGNMGPNRQASYCRPGTDPSSCLVNSPLHKE